MHDIGFIGFGEAARAFTQGWRDAGRQVSIAAYDILLDTPGTRPAMQAACREHGVAAIDTAPALAAGSHLIVSAVTADQTIAAADSVGALQAHCLYVDINSAAPEKKKAAAALIGDHYVDVAVLAPVHPARHQSPMLAGGPRAASHSDVLLATFPNVEIVGTEIGIASLIKMLRSVFVKGLEAVTMECALAAYHAGLAERVFPSLDRAIAFRDTRALADYAMERVATHGVRRGSEMDEVCATLEDLGLPNRMSASAAQMQRLVGDLDLPGTLGPVPQNAEQIAAAVLNRIEPE